MMIVDKSFKLNKEAVNFAKTKYGLSNKDLSSQFNLPKKEANKSLNNKKNNKQIKNPQYSSLKHHLKSHENSLTNKKEIQGKIIIFDKANNDFTLHTSNSDFLKSVSNNMLNPSTDRPRGISDEPKNFSKNINKMNNLQKKL